MGKLTALAVKSITKQGMHGDGEGLYLRVQERKGGATKGWIFPIPARQGQIKGDVDYAKQVYLATDATRLMKEAGLTPPEATKSFSVMGKAFDAAKPEDYITSFAIKRP
jgi:hypothetical protein